MKAMIKIETKLFHNEDFSLLTKNILELKICGKEFYSYYFDLLNELNVEIIYILNNEFKQFVKEYYTSDIFSPKIQFVNEEEIKLIEKNDTLIIKNFGLLLNSCIDIKEFILSNKRGFLLEDNSFKIEYINDSKNHCVSLPEGSLLKVKSIENLSDYIFVSKYLLSNLEEEIIYNIGYSSEDGVVFGKNVVIDKSCKLIKPIVILDNVKISKNCTLGPNTIICSNIFIDENTHISESIIYNNSTISNNLVIQDKITSSNNIINMKNTEKYKIDETFIF